VPSWAFHCFLLLFQGAITLIIELWVTDSWCKQNCCSIFQGFCLICFHVSMCFD
jgi:hypothetical protein